jgi:phosphoglycolate phosphatase-like HAD superfamily hydrolase
MLTYADLDPRKKAFIFELDNVIYPERDYLLQVYYLFANFIEYTETVPAATDLTDFLKKAYDHHGADTVFEHAKEAFGLDEKYRENFEKLHYTAILPLKLLLFDKILTLLQEIVVDRKQLFIITNGDPQIQLNKIRQMEWNGLDKYMTIYFADEIAPKPETSVLEYVLSKHKLNRKDLLIIGCSTADKEFAASAGVDFAELSGFLEN